MSTVLLLPTVRNPRSRDLSYTSPTLTNKSPKRSRQQPSVGHAWLGNNAIFEIVQESLVLKGYQLFAVEKWSVSLEFSSHRPPIFPRVTQMSRSIITLAVYTGDPRHKVGPSSAFSRASLTRPYITDYGDRFESLVCSQTRRCQG